MYETVVDAWQGHDFVGVATSLSNSHTLLPERGWGERFCTVDSGRWSDSILT